MTFIIAEAGVNHNGNMVTARRLVHSAKKAGADAVKFQLFKNMSGIEHLRLSENDILNLHEECSKVGIEFMCTPFYLEAVAFLNPLVSRHKIASGWLRDRTIFDAAVATGKPVIASLGMMPTAIIENLTIHIYNNVFLLHCVSRYPCPDEEANLRKGIRFGVAGYSDHTVGITACIAAAALGAKIIEKHFTFDKTASGPDHSCSAEPHEFAEMVKHIRRVEKML